MPNHRLIHPERAKALAATPVPVQWPSYSGVSTFAGTSPSGKVTVWYDASLGDACKQNAMDLVADADRVVAANDTIFGTVGGHVDVIIFALGGATDGTGGADHMGCDFSTGAQIEVCASFGNSARVSALFEAELSECSMNGQLCGQSTGESLSRWAAMSVSNNALSDFATGQQWFADGMQNFVDTTDPTDQNADSTGCGMVFLSWLMGKMGVASLSQIAQTMVTLGDNGTLAVLYEHLIVDPRTNAWPKFQAAIAALPNGVQSDDPFGALGPQPPVPPTPPNPPGPGISAIEFCTLASEALFAGLAKGESATEIKADVDSIPT